MAPAPSLTLLLCALVAGGADAGVLDNFTARTGPDGLFVVDASITAVTIPNDPSECASLCLQDRNCVSFNFVPDRSTVGSPEGAVCELNKYSSHYTVVPGRNSTYYLRKLSRDDAPAGQAIPWLLNPPLADVTLTAGPAATHVMRRAKDAATRYLLGQYDVDSVLYWFRERAGKPTPGQPHGWDGGVGEPDYPYGLRGSIAGLYLMGVAGHLRWDPTNETLRAALDAVVDGMEECREPDGYLMAYPRNTTMYMERPNYVIAWLTHGLISAHKTGNSKALQLLRDHLDWFNYCEYLPEFLPPDGGPGTIGYKGSDGVPSKWQPQYGHQIITIYQGMIHNTQMALTELGKRRDVEVVTELYQEDWWLKQLITGDPDAVWKRHWYPHNYEVTAFEAYLDVYIVTGNTTYLDAVMGAWRIWRTHFLQEGGSMAIDDLLGVFTDPTDPTTLHWNTSVTFPPSSYYLCSQSTPTCNLGCKESECDMNTGELCGTSFWIKLNQRLHRLNPANETYVAEIERSIYNVGLSAIHADGNVIPGEASAGHRISYFARLHGYKQPGYNIGTCCEGQGTRLLGELPEYLYSISADGDGDLYVDLFAPSEIQWKTKTAQVALVASTVFPYGEAVQIDIKSVNSFNGAAEASAEFALHIRAPSWLAQPTLAISVNGAVVTTVARGTYATVRRAWASGDRVNFDLSMAPRAKLYEGASQVEGHTRYSFTYGPLLLAAVHVDGGGDDGWRRHESDNPFTTRVNLVVAGADGADPGTWMKPVPGAPANFDAGGGIRFLPYVDVGVEQHFTAFPLFEKHMRAQHSLRGADDRSKPADAATLALPTPEAIHHRLHHLTSHFPAGPAGRFPASPHRHGDEV